jgi:uncharacterized RDD family membrane protein YckC
VGVGVGRLALVPGRAIARSFLVRPVLRSAANELAETGREAEERGRRRIEAAANGVLAAPATTRALDRFVAPGTDGEAAVERLVERMLESPALEKVIRDTAKSRLARDLTDELIRSDELQRVVEEVVAGPGLKRGLRRETQTYWDEVATPLRVAAKNVDDRAERLARRVIRRPARERAVGQPRYAGVASRGVAFVADAGITQVAALLVGALVGVIASFLDVSAPGWLTGLLATVGWTVFVGAYFVLFWTTAGQTPGMRVADVRVTDANGLPPRVGRALVRLVGWAIGSAFFIVSLLVVLFDARRRAIPDLVAGTVVVVDDGPDVSEPVPPSARR